MIFIKEFSGSAQEKVNQMSRRLSTVTRKGQVTIPAEIRDALHIREGDTVAWSREGNEVRLSPVRFTIETAFSSVEPGHQPEDFEALERAAKAAKARATIDELNQHEDSPEPV
jgi:AbrB family looped-hinge helix DNA binding protein